MKHELLLQHTFAGLHLLLHSDAARDACQCTSCASALWDDNDCVML
jgi:hypothetical protein